MLKILHKFMWNRKYGDCSQKTCEVDYTFVVGEAQGKGVVQCSRAPVFTVMLHYTFK